MTTPRDVFRRPTALDDHERLAVVLSAADRAWLAHMADVLPPGQVVVGMAIPPRGGVVPDRDWPNGVRLVVAPAGLSGCSR